MAEQRQTDLNHQPSQTKTSSSPSAITSQFTNPKVSPFKYRQKLAQLLADEDAIYKQQIIDMQETPEQIR